MAEIALLMAEEYERAQKWRKEAPAEVPVCVFFSYLPNLRKKADGVSSPPVAKLEVRARKAICAGQATESKTSSFGLAAMEGFFPA
ncbi:unnamed protein product [Spirodela intermedia]|uniref:Uncharacterized protein n=1 Tax=Spirodela intermedia TaxID=51605 RepID=A0A7I8J2V2_SPIIN|nr:unnamed protein product [Spirodela intermedia]CAA6664458.1 unnamed protein product [Spirodela intermedia]